MKLPIPIILLSCIMMVAKGTGARDLKQLLDLGKGIIPSIIPGDLKELFGAGNGKYPVGQSSRCPLCDSSVYSYCSDKLFHDSCCCSGPYDRLPPQCDYADCTFLHSNSCYEHRLITQCCCTNYILYKK